MRKANRMIEAEGLDNFVMSVITIGILVIVVGVLVVILAYYGLTPGSELPNIFTQCDGSQQVYPPECTEFSLYNLPIIIGAAIIILSCVSITRFY